MKTNFRFTVAVNDANGASLGQLPLIPDDEPAWQALSLAVMKRRGCLPADRMNAVITPRWHADKGEPHLSGISVACDGESIVLGLDAFSQPLRAALRHLVDSAKIESEAVAHCEIMAYRGSDLPAETTAIESEVEDTTPPLCRENWLHILEKAGQRDDQHHHAADPDVFIRAEILAQMERLTREAGEMETGAVLIGRILHDALEKNVALEVTGLIPADHTRAASTTLTFTPETWSAVDAAIKLRRRDETVLGWAHSHPVHAWKELCVNCPPERRAVCSLRRPFLSQDDFLLHRAVFYRAFMVALLASFDTEVEFALYGWRDGAVHRRAFLVVAS